MFAVALVELTAVGLGLTLFGLGLLHAYWSLGGSRYRELATPRVNGRPTAAPSPLAFGGLAVALWAAGLVAVSRVAGPVGRGFHGGETAWLWIFAGLFALRAIGDFRLIGFFGRRADAAHRKLERELTAPLCLLLSIGFMRLALLPGSP